MHRVQNCSSKQKYLVTKTKICCFCITCITFQQLLITSSPQLMLCANMTQSTSTSEGEAIQTSENMPKTRTIPDENTAVFQKRHWLSGCLPYSARLEETRCKQWYQLKEHFSSALLEGGHSLKVWIKQMDAYLSVHRFAFSKTEHIQLVTGLWTAVQHLDDDLPTMAKVVPLLNQLLS